MSKYRVTVTIEHLQNGRMYDVQFDADTRDDARHFLKATGSAFESYDLGDELDDDTDEEDE